MRRWSVVMTAHAASDHLAYDALCVISLFVHVPVRPCRGATNIFLSRPEPALGGPACDNFHSIDNFTSMLISNFDYRTLYHYCIQPDLTRVHISSTGSYQHVRIFYHLILLERIKQWKAEVHNYWPTKFYKTGSSAFSSYIYIQGVPGGTDKTSGECSLC